MIYRLIGLDYHYGSDKRQTPAFRLVIDSLTLFAGRLTSVVGQSGSGKTTLLSLLGLLRRPKPDCLFLFPPQGSRYDLGQLNNVVRGSLLAHNIGFVLQRGELLPHLSVIGNLKLPLRLGAWPEPQSSARVQEVLARAFSSEERQNGVAHQLPGQLSLGQHQRASVARALVHQPQILLADEPTGNLDPVNARMVMDLLREHVSRGGSVIMVTHRLDHALEDSDDLIVMAHGRVRDYFRRNDPKSGSWPNAETLARLMTSSALSTETSP